MRRISRHMPGWQTSLFKKKILSVELNEADATMLWHRLNPSPGSFYDAFHDLLFNTYDPQTIPTPLSETIEGECVYNLWSEVDAFLRERKAIPETAEPSSSSYSEEN